MVKLFFLGLFFVLTVFSHRQLREVEISLPIDQLQRREVLYLPNVKQVEVVSFGYKAFVSDILWFNTINYFGKHFRSDQNYIWLKHMCDLVTTLNPRATHAYEFCGLMLAWEGGDPDSAVKVLDKAILNQPGHWRYYYLRGISYAFFFKDEKRAHDDFVEGARKRGAPPFMARLVTNTLANLTDPRTAVIFLEDTIRNSSDPNQKKALTEHLNKTMRELKKDKLNKKLAANGEK